MGFVWGHRSSAWAFSFGVVNTAGEIAIVGCLKNLVCGWISVHSPFVALDIFFCSYTNKLRVLVVPKSWFMAYSFITNCLKEALKCVCI